RALVARRPREEREGAVTVRLEDFFRERHALLVAIALELALVGVELDPLDPPLLERTPRALVKERQDLSRALAEEAQAKVRPRILVADEEPALVELARLAHEGLHDRAQDEIGRPGPGVELDEKAR